MHKVLVVEDDSVQLTILTQTIKKISPEIIIHTANTYKRAISLLNNQHYDLFFLDIVLSHTNQKHNGINLAHIIRNYNIYKHTPIVFITVDPTSIQHAINHIHCYSYIIKPFNTSDIENALTSIASSPTKNDFIFETKDKYGVSFPVSINTLLFIYAKNHILYFVTETDIYTLRRKTLNYIKEKLGKNFVQSHRGQLINIYRIDNYDKSEGKISIGNTILSLSRTYKKEFEEKYNRLIDKV